MILSIKRASDTLKRAAYDKSDVQTSWKTLSIERTHSESVLAVTECMRVARDCGLGGNGGEWGGY